ncbi:PAS domain-containing protein (plasmid) [Polymorphobacter sp. PAMC 29334]|uniref:blue-light-activated histidine kinase n=1 Tax=Polymorphobacter sp. PAMC 29334 TaxID=2862331 RepID=UPI001C77C2C4|nr:PAS domain-containing protein [Polymorphobacter sp. PAMC 29334]QYE33387.1 PAS domain-containing protein [Polymorphobacter sp. PAMC 29334]
MSDSGRYPGHLTGDRSAASTPQALADRRELTFIAVERTRMPMVIVDPRQTDSPIVMANAAFLATTGYPIDEVIGHNCRFLQGRDTDPKAVDEIRRAIADQCTLSIELLNYRKDGSSFWNELFLSPVHDDDGQLIYFFASQLDVSERHHMQELQANKRLMLREIEHRAKNALALVQGIVRLSQADTVEEFSNRVQGRVDALSKAHTVLAEARWRDVPLDRLIRAEIELFSAGQVILHGPEIAIPAAQVQPLALVLHEVVSNAAHHGALSTDVGTLSIRWQSDQGWTCIELRESGGPPPANDRTFGFGMKIMDNIVRRQLRGSVAFDWQPDGLTSVLKLPEMMTP